MPARRPTCRAGIGTGSGLTAVADHDLVDVDGGEARALDRRARRDRAELGRMQVFEGSAVSTDRRARGAEDDDVPNGHELSL